MVKVLLPRFLQDVTGGERETTVAGRTLGEVFDALECRYPGIGARIREGDAVAPVVVPTIDGVAAAEGLRTAVPEQSEVCLLPSFGGG